MGSGSSKNSRRRRAQESRSYYDDEDDFYDEEDDESVVSSIPPSPASQRSFRSNREVSNGLRRAPNHLGETMRSMNITTTPASNTSKLQEQRKKWKAETAKRISVVARVRPLNVREIKSNARDIAYVDEVNNECTVLIPKPSKMIAQVTKPKKEFEKFMYRLSLLIEWW